MTYRVDYSRRSQLDLDVIYQRVAEDCGHAETARWLIERMLDACDSLASFPERFATYTYAPRWRMMPIGNYLVFYRIIDAVILVGHVRHAARAPLSE